MRTRFFKWGRLWGGSFVGVIALCSLVIHPFGAVKRSEAELVAPARLTIPSEVARMLKHSCMDCHSNQTMWPWYSYVAPMSWLVERDVRRGRERLNLSRWDQYDFAQRAKLLADVASAVKNREMPLPQYTLVHRDAKLSDSEIDALYAWARAERRKAKNPSQREYFPERDSTAQ